MKVIKTNRKELVREALGVMFIFAAWIFALFFYSAIK